MNKNIVIVGGGLPGMITAYLVKKKFFNLKVYLIEKTNHLGGLYSSIDFEQRYTFDIGMHLIYSCKNEYLNNFLKKTLYNKWNIFENVKKDIAGVFFNNNLNQKSPYLDLTNLPSNRLEKYKNKIYSLSKTKIKKLNKYKNLAEYFKSRFGNEIYTEVIGPIILKLWGLKGEMMHPLASKIVLMDRLILYKDSLNLSRILTNNSLRSRIGFPNQFSLPKKYYSNQKFALYPKEFGLKNVINFFEKKLIKLDIKIFKNTDIETAKITKNTIQTLIIKKENQLFEIKNISKLFWTSPIYSLNNLLDIGFKSKKINTREQVLVYFLLKSKPRMGKLYYFYCFEKGFNTFRVTNYYNYCRNSKLANGFYSICVELHFDNSNLKKDYEKIAISEILKMNIINKASIVSTFLVSKNSFPLLSVNNVNALNKIRRLILKKNIKNFYLCNQAPEKSIFFLHDILDQNFNLISRFKK